MQGGMSVAKGGMSAAGGGGGGMSADGRVHPHPQHENIEIAPLLIVKYRGETGSCHQHK